MNAIVALDPVQHGALRFDRAAVAARRQLVQIGLSEIALVAADMPLCLAKDEQTGRFNMVALLGLIEPTNLFSHGGRLHATYMPRALAVSCFRLDVGGAGGLAIDPSDPAFGRTGEPLFDDGVPGPLLAIVSEELDAIVADVGAAQRLVDRYAAHGLLCPLRVSLATEDGSEHVLGGLYTIDARAMEALHDDAIVALHRADGLTAAGVLTASLAQVERLRQLHNDRYPRKLASVRLAA